MSPPYQQQPIPCRPGRTLRGWLIRGGAGLLVLSLVGWLAWHNGIGPAWQRRPTRHRTELPPVHPSATATATHLSPSAAEILKRVEPSVVLIEADGPQGLAAIGTGFVVEESGLVATSLHVSAEATMGLARFKSGAVYEIAGYAALDRENDLAILKLRGAPSLAPLTLAKSDPQPLSPVFALGHPQGVEFSPFDGKVSRLIHTSELSQPTQRFVRNLTGSQRDHPWVQHTASLSDGNSGGPLIDGQGQVIGINTWVDRQTGFGYALRSGEITALLEHPLAEVEPLERHATSDARLRSLLWKTSAQKLKELHDEARALQWRPRDQDDYSRLQQLAWAITIANRPDLFAARAALGDRLDELVKQADRAVAQLQREKWNDIGQITLLNEYAASEVARPLAGLVFFGTIERVVASPRGERAALMRLAGFETVLFVPLEAKLNPPQAGAQCLVIGVNDRGRTVQYGDNPLDPIVAPVIIAPVVLVLNPP